MGFDARSTIGCFAAYAADAPRRRFTALTENRALSGNWAVPKGIAAVRKMVPAMLTGRMAIPRRAAILKEAPIYRVYLGPSERHKIKRSMFRGLRERRKCDSVAES